MQLHILGDIQTGLTIFHFYRFRNVSYAYEVKRIRRTLASCALVCRGLYLVSRRALCAVLCTLSSDDAQVLLDMHREHPEWFNDTRQILINTSSAQSSALPVLPITLASDNCLPKLSTFCIDDHECKLYSLTKPRSYASLAQFNSLTHIVLSRCNFKTFEEFLSLACIVPHLSTLTLHRCNCMHEATLTSASFKKQLRLTSISSSGSSNMSAALYLWLSRTPSSRSIRHLTTVCRDRPTELKSLYDFVATPYSLLSEIEVDVQVNRRTSIVILIVSLCQPVSTDTLKLGPEYQLELYIKLLSSIKNPNGITRLQFHIRGFPRKEPSLSLNNPLGDAEIWRSLDVSLTSNDFFSLKNVIITLHPHIFFHSWQEKDVHLAVEEKLPQVHNRGILRVKVNVESRTFMHRPLLY